MTVGPDIFLDTNVLIYAASGHDADPMKYEVAQGLLTSNFATSGQILAEFFNVATRKISTPMDFDEAARWVELLGRKPCQPITAKVVSEGIRISKRYQTSYWDGAIIAAAKAIGATKILTEDLNDMQDYDGVLAVNPFLPNFNYG